MKWPSRGGSRRREGFTLIELMITCAVLATVSAMGIVKYAKVIEAAEEVSVEKELEDIQNAIDLYFVSNGELPESLADLGMEGMLDPWGNPYQYTNFETVDGNGKKRKDKCLVPINSTYDLYSMGPDGKTASALTAKISQDDIIRANDGGYIGIASEY